MGFRVQSKSQSSVSVYSALDVLISCFNKMNPIAYNSSHSSHFECFTSNNDENKETILKELVEAREDHRNPTSKTKDTIIINLGITEEP